MVRALSIDFIPGALIFLLKLIADGEAPSPLARSSDKVPLRLQYESMDLQNIKHKVSHGRYASFDEFALDVKHLLENCIDSCTPQDPPSAASPELLLRAQAIKASWDREHDLVERRHLANFGDTQARV